MPHALNGPKGLNGLAEYCASALAEHNCPSVSVAVVEHGEVVLAEAHGLADVTSARPATPETAYALASITKPMTATAICVAADKGLLDLDAPVPVPVPGDHGWPTPTVRQLLQHRGGFGAHYDFHYAGHGDGERIDATPYAMLRRPPGTDFEYANLGYRALGHLLEEATGQGLADFVREQVFEPLGLTALHLGPTYPGPAPHATRYTTDGRTYPPYCDTSHPGATLGWAPAAQLALFAQSYDRLLKPETAASVLDAGPVTPSVGYGLGWCLSRGTGPLVRSHGGGMGGVAAIVVTVPEQHLSVSVLTNSTDKAARDGITHHILGALVPGFSPESINPFAADPVRPPRLRTPHWRGSISTPEGDIPMSLTVSPEDNRARLHLNGETAEAQASASQAWDLQATFPLQLPTADARINSPALSLHLRRDKDDDRDNGGLSGVARAFKSGDAEGLLGNLLTHTCQLRPC
ncbi:serine hydrolase domain-containing protein [Streptomyces sp. SID12488]|uniref:serine hydrolase domain-containing protein n=1 Tax=Streptomyces sp. SID12488 TaxID=2706040 RepID=UPI0013DCA72A|nr:serine hydrolase domain-containing protein [Streptomyces sp. SID12488]NEA61241.1 beta-lactamase family protein [Streptomyces sp. SID12488]